MIDAKYKITVNEVISAVEDIVNNGTPSTESRYVIKRVFDKIACSSGYANILHKQLFRDSKSKKDTISIPGSDEFTIPLIGNSVYITKDEFGIHFIDKINGYSSEISEDDLMKVIRDVNNAYPKLSTSRSRRLAVNNNKETKSI